MKPSEQATSMGDPQGSSILSKASVVSAMTAISRVVGLLRELLMAHFFGTSAVQSAFVIAFRIPNLFRRLFGEGALGGAFTPVFVEIVEREGVERASLFAGRIIGLLLMVMGVMVCLLMGGTYLCEGWLEPGSRWMTILPLMRIMLPYSILICVAAILSAMLYARGRFARPALTPGVLNLIWVGVLVGICPFVAPDQMTRIMVVCWGILVAGVIQVAFQLPELRRLGIHVGVSVRGWRQSIYVKRVLLLMAPAALGIGLSQINICMDGWLAYYAAEWAPAALEYADRIIYLPLGMFATAFMTVLLPTYSQQYQAQQIDAMKETLINALRNLLFLMIPITLGLICFSREVIELIYLWKNGAFNSESALYTARAILAYAPGLVVFSIGKCVVPAFYAMQDLRTPVRVSVMAVVLNFAMNVTAIFVLPYGWAHAGMALSTVLSSLFSTVILSILLSRRIGHLGAKAIGQTAGKLLVASAVACGGMVVLYQAIAPWMGEGKLYDLLHLSLPGTIGGMLYLAILYGIDRQGLMDLLAALPLKKLKRK